MRMCGIKIVIEDAFVKFTVSGRFDSENASTNTTHSHILSAKGKKNERKASGNQMNLIFNDAFR